MGAEDVVVRSDLIRLLGGRRALDRALAEGEYQRLLQGVYAPAHLEPDLLLRCRAAQLLLPPSARVADRCLLWVLGVDVLPPGPPLLEVVVPRGACRPGALG